METTETETTRRPARTIAENSTVILLVNDQYQFATAKRGTAKLNKRSVHLEALIGAPWGAWFEVKNDRLVRCERSPQETVAAEIGLDEALREDEEGRPEALFDDNTAQKLSAEDLRELKQKGVGGGAIIKSLIEHSASFQDRTEFSKEKYIKKKTKKYYTFVRVIRPTSSTICRVYFETKPWHISRLRVDSLAMMLSLANVHANARVLVHDSGCDGLLTGAVAERLGGRGRVVAVHNGQSGANSARIVSQFNFDRRTLDSICPLPFARLPSVAVSAASAAAPSASSVPSPASSAAASAALPSTSAGSSSASSPVVVDTGNGSTPTPLATAPVEPAADTASSSAAAALPAPSAADATPAAAAAAGNVEPAAAAAVPASGSGISPPALSAAEQRIELARRTLLDGCDSLLVASQLEPSSAFLALLPYLALSRPFAVYSQHLQPLAELHHKLLRSGSVASVELSETWLRNYQVLPGRTHPAMQMSGASGFVLSGIKVDGRSGRPVAGAAVSSSADAAGDGRPAKKQKQQS